MKELKNKIIKLFVHNCKNEARVVGIYGGDKKTDTHKKITYKCRVCNNVWETLKTD